MPSETGWADGINSDDYAGSRFPHPIALCVGSCLGSKEQLVFSSKPELGSWGFCRAKPRLCRSSSFQLCFFNFNCVSIPKQEVERSCGNKDFRGKRASLLTLKSY